MFRAIARAIAAALASFKSGFDWTINLAMTPFRMMFGGGGGGRPAPEFDPQISGLDMLDDLKAQMTPEVHQLNRDGINTIMGYLRATPHSRPTVDLSGLSKPIRATLLTMNELELDALRNAGLGAVRKFLAGADHAVHGVPLVRAAVADDDAPTLSTPEERVRHAVRKRIANRDSKPFVLPKFFAP